MRDQIEEQRRANKELLAQVARVVDLEDEVERLSTQSRELLATLRASQEKVVNLPVQNNFPVQNASAQVKTALEQTNVKLSPKLHQEIYQHSPEAVLKAIEAFEQYRSENGVQKPAAYLLRAIQEEWVPNVAEEPITAQEREFDEW